MNGQYFGMLDQSTDSTNFLVGIGRFFIMLNGQLVQVMHSNNSVTDTAILIYEKLQ